MSKELTLTQEFLIQKCNVYFPVEKDIRILIYAQFGCYILLHKNHTYYLFKLSDISTDLLFEYKVGFIEDANFLYEEVQKITNINAWYYKTMSKDMLLQWIETNS